MPSDAARAALALAALLLAGACSRETRSADTALAGIPERSVVPAPAVEEIRAYARHLDSLAFMHELRVVLRDATELGDPEQSVWGYYQGDDLVIARGLTGGDPNLLRYVRVYLRDGAPVLFVLARDASDQRSVQPSGVAHWYLNADTIIEATGHASPAQLPALLARLASFRTELARVGRTVDSAVTDTLLPRPHAPYVVRGACPFECCHYGDWNVLSAVELRAAPTAGAPVVRRIAPETLVLADSGFVRLDTIGMVAVERRLTDEDARLDFAAGDTLLLLDYVGEGFNRAWLRGHQITVSQFWDSAGKRGARLLRRPVARWWAHVALAAGTDSVRGWLDMSGDSVQVTGNDECGN